MGGWGCRGPPALFIPVPPAGPFFSESERQAEARPPGARREVRGARQAPEAEHLF